jgi:sec-independent protein translocase protein TatC
MKNQDKLMPLKFHLGELRIRILVCLGSVLIFSSGGFVFWPKILDILLPEDMTIIYTSPQEALLVRFKMSFALGLLFSIPLIAYEAWKYLRPALTPKERHIILYFISMSLVLFALGVTFSLYIVFPLMVSFFINTAQPTLTPLISISNYSTLALNMTMAFAVVSQMPMFMAIAAGIGLIDPLRLAMSRGYAVIAIFVAAAVFTPPDAFSQIALALPMCGLFELGILLAKLVKRAGQSK